MAPIPSVSQLRSWGAMLDPDHYLCCTFWGSTPSPAPVPSMSHLTLCGGSTRDQDPAPDPYLCCTFWASPPSPAPVPSMSHLTLCGGSTRDQDPAPDPYLCCTFWGSTPSPAPVPSMSHLKSCGAIIWVPKILHYLHKWTFHPIFLFYLNIICSMFT